MVSQHRRSQYNFKACVSFHTSLHKLLCWYAESSKTFDKMQYVKQKEVRIQSLFIMVTYLVLIS
jgi:hypothetical protein